MSVHAGNLEISEHFQIISGARQNVSDGRWKLAFRLGLVLSDGLMLGLAFLAAYWIRFDLKVTVAPEVVPPPMFYLKLVALMIPVWLCLFAFHGLYRWENLLGGITEYARAFNATTVGVMFVVVGNFLIPTVVLARGWLILSWVLGISLVVVARFGARRIVYYLQTRGRFLVPTIIVGSNGEAFSLATQLSEPRSGYRVIGMVSSNQGAGEFRKGNIPHLGTEQDIVSLVSRYGARDIVVAASSMERSNLLELYERLQPLEGVEVHLSTGLYEVLTTGVAVKTAASVPLIRLNRLRLATSELLTKTALEYFMVTASLVLLIPLFALLALLIKLDSRGPVIYRRRVLGFGGNQFDAFKFRTMRIDGEQILKENPGLQESLRRNGKLKDDPRVTRLGKWLRRYSLDELPQLVNVILGQMSLVGPRMLTAEEAQKYGSHRANLLTVKPGMTGLWQVSGRSDLNYNDRVRLDMHYIRNYSIWRDLQILLVQTPGAVFRGHGAY